MRKYLDRRFMLGSVVIAVLAFTGIASGTISARKPNTYSACVPPNGSMRLVNPGSSCKSRENLITWNQSGERGATGHIGSAGATGPAGEAGKSAGASGATGLTGVTGANGLMGASGPAGATGTAGTAGTSGTAGTNGTNGLPGSNGVSGYTYVYNLGAQVVSIPGGQITFDTNGPTTAAFTHTAGAAAITVVNAGVYKVSFSVTGTETNQMAVFLNGTIVAGSTYGSGAINQQNNGQVIFSASAGATITIRNNTAAAATTLQTLAGGSATIANASVLVEQLS